MKVYKFNYKNLHLPFADSHATHISVMNIVVAVLLSFRDLKSKLYYLDVLSFDHSIANIQARETKIH